MWLVARRELRAAFGSPVGYILAVVFLAITGWLFFSTFFLEGRADMRAFFELLPITLALVAPAITMRQLSEELSSGTYESALTLSADQILVGKFVASLLFVVIVMLPTIAYPLSVARVVGDNLLTRLDWGPVVGGYIGAILLAALYCAVGLLASSASRNQIVSFILALAVCAFLGLVDRMLFVLPSQMVAVIQFLSATVHFQSVARGVLDTRDLVYFLSFGAAALVGAHAVMQVRRG